MKGLKQPLASLSKRSIYREKTIFVLVFLFWFIFFGLIYLNNKSDNQIKLEFDIAIHSSATEKNIGEFYFNTGNGFNESQSVKFEYHQDANSSFSHHRVVLPINRITQLRFDPLPAQGQITLQNFYLHKFYPKKMDFEDKENSLRPLNSIESIDIVNERITITSNGLDPHLILSNELSTFSLLDWKVFFEHTAVDRFIAGLMSLILLSYLIAL